MENKFMKKIVEVVWRDSQMYLTQCESDADFKISEITSVGFLISEDKYQIVLAGDALEEDVRRVIAIPIENVMERKVLE